MIETQISEILTKYDFISNILLFGSYAAGKNSYLSDIDIAIHTTKELELLELGSLISLLESTLDIKVDLVILNELYKKSPLLAYNIYQSHKIISIRDKKRYREFKSNALHYYMDFKPVLEAQNRAFLKRIEDGTLAKIKTA